VIARVGTPVDETVNKERKAASRIAAASEASMQSVAKFLTPHLQELVRTAVRRNMAPPFDLRLTGPTGDHFQYQIDEKGEILSQEDRSPLPSLLLAYLPLRITLVDSEGEGLEITIPPRAVERAA
jgi:hypothetical protein